MNDLSLKELSSQAIHPDTPIGGLEDSTCKNP